MSKENKKTVKPEEENCKKCNHSKLAHSQNPKFELSVCSEQINLEGQKYCRCVKFE